MRVVKKFAFTKTKGVFSRVSCLMSTRCLYVSFAMDGLIMVLFEGMEME